MSTEVVASDCPVCLSAGSVSRGRCQLCEADFGEAPVGAVDLPPAAPPDDTQGFLRFSDVLRELGEVGTLVSNANGASEIENACRRVQTLLLALRLQFLNEVVVTSPSGYPKRPVT